MKQKIHILADDREKKGWDQEYFGDEFKITVDRMVSGDYTIRRAENLICIERKSNWEELVSNLSTRNERERFCKELHRMQGFPLRWILVESDISRIRYIRKFTKFFGPDNLIEWINRIALEFGIPIICTGTRMGNKHFVQRFFRQIVELKKKGRLYYYG